MADHNKSASTGFSLCSKASSGIAPRAFLEIDKDYLVFDGHIRVEYRQLGTNTRDAAGNVTRTDFCVYTVQHALTHKVTDRDVRLNEGWLRVGDIWFEMWKDELPIEPKIGDEVIFEDHTYRVVGFGHPTIRLRHQFACRR